MNRLITAHVADTSACPKRQAVFYLRESNEPCADKTDDSRCELAHNRMAAVLDAYGERRDIELKRKRKRDGGMAINRTKESRIMKKIFKDHGYESLLPSGEASQDINRKEIE